MKISMNIPAVALLCLFFGAQALATTPAVHCTVTKYTQGNGTLNAEACGTVDFGYPDPVKGAIETAKGVGTCTELAAGVFRGLPNLAAIEVVLGYYDPKYTSNLAFTEQSSSVIFYDQIPRKFALDFNGKQHHKVANFRAICELQ